MSCWNRSGLKVRRGQFSLTMRILITGGFGFVGGRLAEYLAQAGHQVVLGSRKEINSPDGVLQAEAVKIEWNDEGALERCCEGVDVVIHAAGMNAQDCADNPVEALVFNGVATARLVAAAIRANIPRFIYLSTAHVYDSPLAGIITEETCPGNLHPYATSHLAGEYALLSGCLRGQTQGIVLRLSNAFGAPMHQDVNCWMLLVNDLCRQAVEKRKLVLRTSGLQQRDFIGMTDVCHVVERLVMRSAEYEQATVFNVGAGISQSVLEMAQLIQQRSSQVLGFEPVLQRAEGPLVEQNAILIYKSDNLISLGITSKALDARDEIDRLLLFCQRTFTQTQNPNT
jgi:UDP-glucose 4-epimerase